MRLVEKISGTPRHLLEREPGLSWRPIVALGAAQ
jgi:hypothetical protein